LILQKLIQLLDTQVIKEVILPEGSMVFGPCLSYGRKIICVGLNYKHHAVESKMTVPEVPLLFSKFDNTLSGHQEDIYLPMGSLQVDYEAELVVVIGKRAKHVSIEDSLSHLFGYCNVNDLSARDLQFKTSQWLLGKSCDGFSPVGPYLVTSDEVVNPNNLQMKCFVNGEIRQNSNTSDMIFSVEHIVSYISRYMTLEPGDAILTGILKVLFLVNRWLTRSGKKTVTGSQLKSKN
jgi:2-keto-4-pentenoate hydratase/2-oxohepta-3-ene-1,7-dioic acid hydratase in catechol pathway